jgi:hypothetical protein
VAFRSPENRDGDEGKSDIKVGERLALGRVGQNSRKLRETRQADNAAAGSGVLYFKL